MLIKQSGKCEECVRDFGQFDTVQSTNVEFVRAFLSMAKINIVEDITLQEDAQKIIFDTETGEVEVVWLSNEL